MRCDGTFTASNTILLVTAWKTRHARRRLLIGRMLNSIMTNLNFSHLDILNGGVGIMGLVEFQTRALGRSWNSNCAGGLNLEYFRNNQWKDWWEVICDYISPQPNSRLHGPCSPAPELSRVCWKYSRERGLQHHFVYPHAQIRIFLSTFQMLRELYI